MKTPVAEASGSPVWLNDATNLARREHQRPESEQTMTRTEICHADDFDTLDRLQSVLAELGIMADDTWHDSAFGLGLTRLRRNDQELTVFRDAWIVDIAGPAELVNEVLAALQD
jgi:hypothetical protein